MYNLAVIFVSLINVIDFGEGKAAFVKVKAASYVSPLVEGEEEYYYGGYKGFHILNSSVLGVWQRIQKVIQSPELQKGL